MEDIKEFADNFMACVGDSAEVDMKDFDEELTEYILEYIKDSGDVGEPTICSFKKRMTSLNAYDYNYEGDSLDLFVLIKTPTLLGKISKGKIDDAFSRLTHFYEVIRSGKIENEIENPNNELAEIDNIIKSTIGKVSTVRLYVLTNGLCDDYDTSTYESDFGFIVEQNIWDIHRVYQQDCIKSGKSGIIIDFPTIYSTKIQCLHLLSNNKDVDSYLAIIPAITLASIYKEYHHALLEKNVRTFLQFKPKVNKGIRKTLHDEPDMFFSYNNGISSTASAIETVRKDGSLFITKLKNWQIVNGGQTTGTIASVYNEKGSDLSEVYVPMKISVISDDEKAKILVDRISRNANSQTGIKKSDFSANDPYLVQLEELSRAEWVPSANNKPTTKWYFERIRGQYLDELAQKRGANEKFFRIEYPKNHKVTKTQMAIYEESWNQYPNLVCKGPEESYLHFVKQIQSSNISVTSSYYRKIIAKAILYNEIDKLVRNSQLGGYKANMNAYILSSLSFLSDKKLDLDTIWERQCVQKALIEIISNLIPIVRKHLTDLNANSQAVNPSTWSKNNECWESLKLKLNLMNKIPESLLLSPENMIDASLTQARKERILEAWNYKPEIWFVLSKWSTRNNMFTPVERKLLFTLGCFRSKNRQFTFKQANDALILLERATDIGFIM